MMPTDKPTIDWIGRIAGSPRSKHIARALMNSFTSHLATIFVCLLAVYTLNVFDFAEITGSGLPGLAKLVTIAVLAAAIMSWSDKWLMRLVAHVYGGRRTDEQAPDAKP